MADAELAKKLEKRNKINEGEIAPAIQEDEAPKAQKETAKGPDGPKDKQLSKILEKRNKINEGEMKPGMNTETGSPLTAEQTAEDELAKALQKRAQINEGELAPTMNNKGISVYSENKNLSRRCILELESKFNSVADPQKKTALNIDDLKVLFEALGSPQTHITLKTLLKEAGKDQKKGEITFREFLDIFQKACSEEVDESSPLKQLAVLNEIDVGEKGVSGAKEFFQAKMKASGDSDFAREIELEKIRKAEEEQEAKEKQDAFNAMRAKFTS